MEKTHQIFTNFKKASNFQGKYPMLWNTLITLPKKVKRPWDSSGASTGDSFTFFGKVKRMVSTMGFKDDNMRLLAKELQALMKHFDSPQNGQNEFGHLTGV